MTGGSHPTVGRRRVLRATAGVVPLAGCLGGDGTPADDGRGDGAGTGGDDDAGSPDDTAGSAVGCGSVTHGYDRFDGGAAPVVADFEYPAVLGDLEIQTIGAVLVEGRRPLEGSDDGALGFQYNQALEGKAEPNVEGTPESTAELAIATTVDFGGESVQVLSNAAAETDAIGLSMSLPSDVDGETRYFFTQLNLSVVNTDEISADCGDSLVAAARHVANSLEPNPDTTIGQEQA